MTLKDVHDQLNDVIIIDDRPVLYEMKNWRDAIAEALKKPGQEVSDALKAENLRDNHEDRIRTLEQENIKQIATNIDLKQTIRTLTNVLAESGFNTNRINEND